MSAYLIGQIQVTDLERYQAYMKASPRVNEKFGGRFIVRGGERVTLEGPEETRRIVVIEFPSFDQVKAFFASPEYAEIKKLREGAAIASFVAVDGV